jgi:histidinol-phosphate aminotransferase
MSIAALARPEIAALHPYVTAAQQPETVRLNANEASQSPAAPDTLLHRYPQIRPGALAARLAAIYGVNNRNVLVTRGSSEAIDLLVRTFCRAYTDNIVITPPTFAMYRVYADMQAADVVEAPLTGDGTFALDPDAVLAACTPGSKLIFLCSPNNPTGDLLSRSDVLRIASRRAGKSLVVVDEAYVEFSDRDSLAGAIYDHDNLVILRTLSKAYGLAGTRCGSVIANEEVIRLLSTMLAPYAFSAPTTECLLAALSEDAVARMEQFVATVRTERARVQQQLGTLPFVAHVWPSSSNFLLVRFNDLARITAALQNVNVLIRAFGNDARLHNCARITIGSSSENDLMLECLRKEAGSLS